MRTGNLYLLVNPYTTEDGRVMENGAICQYADGYLSGYDDNKTYTRFKADLVPEGDVLLYEETPYNKECRERRERIATAAMQGIFSNGILVQLIIDDTKRLNPDCNTVAALRKRVSEVAVAQDDALIKELTDGEFDYEETKESEGRA